MYSGATFLVAGSTPFVESLNAWSTFGAMCATTVSAVFIAWQIALTRKSVQTTEATLVVARDEFEHSRLLQVEAKRAAIDAEMPRLFVTAGAVGHVAATDDRVPDIYAPSRSSAKRLDAGHEFALPRDREVRLEVTSRVVVLNDGPRRAEIFLDVNLAPVKGRVASVIANGEADDFYVTRVQTVEEWAEIARRRSAGETDDVEVGCVTYVYPGDVSAIERHSIRQGGTVLAPAPDREGVWLVRDFGAVKSNDLPVIGTAVQPFTREYWASRVDNRRL